MITVECVNDNGKAVDNHNKTQQMVIDYRKVLNIGCSLVFILPCIPGAMCML